MGSGGIRWGSLVDWALIMVWMQNLGSGVSGGLGSDLVGAMGGTLAQASGSPNWLLIIGTIVFFFVCIVLILSVLIQKPQGGGLSGAFGASGGSGQTAFGAKTGDVLTLWTIAMFVLFVGLAVALNFVARPSTAAPGQATATSAPGDETVPGEGEADGGAEDAGAGDAAVETPADAPVEQPVEAPVETPVENGAGEPDDGGAGGGN